MRTTTHRLVTASLATLALAAGGLGATATPAGAAEDPASLTLTGPVAATLGAPAVMTASGHVPVDAFLERYVYVYAVPTSVVSACPAARTNALQLADASSGLGGHSVAFVNVVGDFSVPIAWTPTHTGTFLLCGYLSDMVTDEARAQHVVSASGGASAPAPTSPPPSATALPGNTTRPSVVQRGRRLVCKRGAWTAATSYSYRWKLGGKYRAGATTKRLALTRSMRGKKVQCAVTARSSAGSRTVLSRARRVR